MAAAKILLRPFETVAETIGTLNQKLHVFVGVPMVTPAGARLRFPNLELLSRNLKVSVDRPNPDKSQDSLAES